jgi:hypothetical protein
MQRMCTALLSMPAIVNIAITCSVTPPLHVLQGRPIYIQLLGKIDIGTLKQITTEERMIKFHIQEYERCGKVIMPICSKLQGRQIDQTFGIMDVKGEQGVAPTAVLLGERLVMYRMDCLTTQQDCRKQNVW